MTGENIKEKNVMKDSLYSWKNLLWLVITIKLSLLLAIFLAAYLLPFYYELYVSDFSYLPVYDWSPWLNFSTWDGRHYSYLAEHGYSAGLASNVFYPLYPLLIWVLGWIIPNTILAGYLVSNVASLIAFYFLYGFIKKAYNEKIAFYSALLLLAFPTSFFFSIMYSESVFLMIVLGFFYFWQKQNYWSAAIMAFLLPSARPLGVLLVIPILAFWLCSRKERYPFTGNWKVGIAYLLAVILGFGAYLLSMDILTGSPFSGFEAQRNFISGFSISNLFHPLDWFLRNFITLTWSLHGYLNSILDRLVFVGVLVSLWLLYKRESFVLWVYTVVMALVPALLGMFMAYSRYVLVLFPIAILLARCLKEKVIFVVVPLFVLQILFAVMHSLNFWIA